MNLQNDLSRHPHFWAAAWEKACKYFSLNVRVIRSDAEMIEYWDHFASKYQKVHSTSTENPRVNKLLAILNREGFLDPAYDVLDIGCGPGNYTLPLAKICRHVTAIDSSSKMCSMLELNSQAQSINNIKVLHRLWEELDVEQEEMTGKYDLVLASMTTAVSDLETLKKMNQASANNCCLAFWAEKGSNRVQEELWRLIFNEKAPEYGMASVIYPFNLLFSLGYFPKIEFIDTEWSHKEPPEEAVESLCHMFWLYTDITPRVKKIIEKYVAEKTDNGLFVRKTVARIGVVTWKKEQVQTVRKAAIQAV